MEAACAVSAECYGAAHRAQCRCPAGTRGDPRTRCARADCELHADCADDHVCEQGACRPACAAQPAPCAPNADCFARNHAASCRCPPALPLGDPLVYCQKIKVIGEPECRMDGDCPSGRACLRDQCREPCAELRPCAGSARCSVSDSTPFRTLICRCPEGFIPDDQGACRPAQLPPLSCSSDHDCSEREACINRMCRNPCDCGDNAECFIKEHRPVCTCRAGYGGDPHRACRVLGCRAAGDCEPQDACVNGLCISPCLLNSTCGPNAECYAERGAALCRCPAGYEGDAYVGCSPVECRSNGDCPLDKQCHAHRCIDPCLTGNNCGANAQCLVRNHIPVCKCEPGYDGSPYIECRRQITAECSVDADCPAQQACLGAACVNPCSFLRPCGAPARCAVSDTLPVRTMLCTCPPGYVSQGGGVCRPQTPIEEVACELDLDCNSNSACISAVCRSPCRCGPHAACVIREHKPVCACEPGYFGDARSGCFSVECRADSQCADDETCINSRCVPACAAEPDACADSAECYAVRHRAECRCRPGTAGDPSVGCSPVGCRADSDCPSDRACENAKCVEPCTSSPCSAPAECRVVEHEAHCVCPPGHRATDAGCARDDERECRADPDCPSGTACLSARCVNPCLDSKPCGTNAQCSVADSLPVRTMICECIPGYSGNALVECTPNRRKYTIF